MTKVSVVCALPPEKNTGMLTVDLAAHKVLPRLFPSVDFEYYIFDDLNPQYSYNASEIPLNYKSYSQHAEDYAASDRFLFWGDFFHSHSYFAKDVGEWDENVKSSYQSNFERFSEFYFLSNRDVKTLQQSAVFGSTIIPNSARDFLSADYAAAYDRLFSNLKVTLLRDAISAARLHALNPDRTNLGCDAAYLLESSDLEALDGFKLATAQSGVGLFLRRTPDYVASFSFAKRLARALNEPLTWLPWFWSRRRLAMIGKGFGVDVVTNQPSPGEILSQLSGYKLIVTDTYHVCVNAWRMGIPAVCIGDGGQHSVHSLSDKKKEIMYSMYEAQELYVFSEQLKGRRSMKRSVETVAGTLGNSEILDRIHRNIRAHRSAAMQNLSTFIADVSV